jgi:Tol biopolymer transport system component
MKLQHAISEKLSIGLFLAMFVLLLPLVAAAQGKIAFHSCGFSDGSCEIYLMNADGSNQVNLTNTPGNDFSPSISPNGSKIAFYSNRDGNNEIYVMNIDGSNQTRLTNNSASDNEPSFGPNGKIVFHSFRDGAGGEIYIMNDDGSNQTRLTNNTVGDFRASISHDGSKIVFVVQLAPGIDTDIFVMNADGSGRTRLTFSTNWETNPSFSPDDARIAFDSQPGDVFGGEIWTMNADGSGHARLTNNPADDTEPTFSPDGSKIAFRSDRDGYPKNEIYTMNVNGSNQTRITNSTESKGGPSWGVEANAAPTITAFGATLARDSSASNVSIASVSDAEDAENALSVTVNGSSSASSNGVTVSGIAVDSSGNVTANISATCGASAASFTLRVTDGGALFAEATLNVSVTAETIAPTLSLPANIVTSLPLNSTDTSKVVNFTVSAIDNCDANPTVSAMPQSGSAFPVGTTTVNVTGTDASGNTATGSFTVTVQYNFAGFFQPIDNLPMVNVVNAGQSVPVKFSLSGDKGLNIFAAGYPSSQQIACIGGATVSPIEETTTAGSSSLSYDAATDRYIYVWKTEKAWKGTCRQLIVKLADGTLHVANFQFK